MTIDMSIDTTGDTAGDTTTHDENWAIAESIQLTPARESLGYDQHGVVIARPHPTGWLISARYQPTLSGRELEDFAEFVRLGTFALLEQGPREGSWETQADGYSRAYCVPSRSDQGLLAAVRG